MKLLIDASLSPMVAQELHQAGHDAVHVGDVLSLATLVLANLPEVEVELDAGAVVVTEERRLRVRALPSTEPGKSRRP